RRSRFLNDIPYGLQRMRERRSCPFHLHVHLAVHMRFTPTIQDFAMTREEAPDVTMQPYRISRGPQFLPLAKRRRVPPRPAAAVVLRRLSPPGVPRVAPGPARGTRALRGVGLRAERHGAAVD